MSQITPAGEAPMPPAQQQVLEAAVVTRRRARALKGGDIPRHLRANRTAYLMIAPMVIVLGIFVIWPLLYSFYLSTFEISFYKDAKFVGAQFYLYVLTSAPFWKSIGVGLYYAVLVVPTGMVLALLLATFIKSLSRRAASFLKVTVYLPAVVSSVIAAQLFIFIYQDHGVANWLLSLINSGPINWLNDPATALPSVALPGIWLGFGVTTLIMLAGLLDIPESYYESAQLDGAGYLQRMFYITIPLLKNVLLYLLVTGFTLAIQMLDLPLLMTGGGPLASTTTPNLYIFNAFRDRTPYATSYSLTASLLLFVVIGALSLLLFKLIRSDKAVDA